MTGILTPPSHHTGTNEAKGARNLKLKTPAPSSAQPTKHMTDTTDEARNIGCLGAAAADPGTTTDRPGEASLPRRGRLISLRRCRVAGVLCLGTLSLMAGPASASHNGNNQAEIFGTGDPDASGHVLVNYSDGSGEFNATVVVSNLEPGGTYEFSALREGTYFVMCAGTANSQGHLTCSAQHIVLPGFAIGVVRDSTGTQVAMTGTFDRRGNCREPAQERTLCEAPGHKK